jgi:peptidoglycan/LPS O-acetylase OafA/YrhL
MESGTKTAGESIRVGGVDTIRIVCAIAVVACHLGLFPKTAFGADPHGLPLLLKGLFNTLINGEAALIVFFVISGFGIHFAARRDLTVDVPSFYSRRLIRIAGPALVGLVIWTFARIPLQIEGPGPFWTITCETEYYLLYPLLLALRRQFGWWPLIIVGEIFAYGLALTHLGDIRTNVGAYPCFGWWNWVMGLPCWLLGCWLAENYHRFPELSTAKIWLVRIGLFAVAFVMNVLRFHGGSVFFAAPFFVNLFVSVECFWLGLEIAYRRSKPAPRVLEWAGNWTYSIYLMHPAVPGLLLYFAVLTPFYTSPALNLFMIFCSFVLAYGFHLAVEAPFYNLAIKIGKRVKARRRPAPVLAVPDA